MFAFSQSTGGAGGGPDPRSTGFVANPKARLRDQVHEAMRFFHYSPRTEEAYWGWIVRYLKFHRRVKGTLLDQPEGSACSQADWRHPREMGAAEVAAFLSHLANDGQVAAATVVSGRCYPFFVRHCKSHGLAFQVWGGSIFAFCRTEYSSAEYGPDTSPTSLDFFSM